MTEDEWLRSANVPELLGSHFLRPSDRKLRLLVLSWWQDPFQYRELRGEPRSEWQLACGHLITLLGHYAEGQVPFEEVQQARVRLEIDQPDLGYATSSYAYDYLVRLSQDSAWQALVDCWQVLNSERHAHEDPDHAEYNNLLRCDVLREIIGNPFRPVTFAPEWRTSTAVAIAEGMYESRDFSAMPILADALQDAGCDSDDVLNHCRDDNATHVRGCWVVDLVLGKA